MKPLTVFLLILLILFGFFAVVNQLTPRQSFFDEFNNLIFSCVVLLTLITFFIGLRRFRKDKKIKHFAIAALPGLIICLFIIVKIYEHESIDKETTILRVVNLGGAGNVLQFEFKKRNHFRLVEYSLLNQTIYYGNYKLEKNIIDITSSNYDGNISNFPATGI